MGHVRPKGNLFIGSIVTIISYDTFFHSIMYVCKNTKNPLFRYINREET